MYAAELMRSRNSKKEKEKKADLENFNCRTALELFNLDSIQSYTLNSYFKNRILFD
jgi:hypothetical protein